MRQFIRNYLTFNKRERNGIFVLLIIIIAQLVYLSIADKFTTTKITDFTKFEAEIKIFEQSIQKSGVTQEDDFIIVNNPVNTSDSGIRYFVFNPNHLPAEDWKRLGLSDKQIKVIQHYEAKGGRFISKNDVKKMYCISEKQYLLLEPYIKLPDFKNKIIDLNHADSAEFETLKGIGGFYANAIIKYREQLGGYYDKKQLLELWKFDENKLKVIKNAITVDTSGIKKININTCNGKQLKHPYLSWNQVNGIINYRNKHGGYHSIEQLKNTDLMDDKTFKKIAPYLTIE